MLRIRYPDSLCNRITAISRVGDDCKVTTSKHPKIGTIVLFCYTISPAVFHHGRRSLPPSLRACLPTHQAPSGRLLAHRRPAMPNLQSTAQVRDSLGYAPPLRRTRCPLSASPPRDCGQVTKHLEKHEHIRSPKLKEAEAYRQRRRWAEEGKTDIRTTRELLRWKGSK